MVLGGRGVVETRVFDSGPVLVHPAALEGRRLLEIRLEGELDGTRVYVNGVEWGPRRRREEDYEWMG